MAGDSSVNTSSTTQLRAGMVSDAGKKRTVNEDACGHIKGAGFEVFLVSDGMGGPTCGAVAAELTISTFKKFIQPKSEIKVEDLVKGIEEANRAVFTQAENDPELSGMGSTATALCFAGNKVFVANVGNSRAYRVRDGEIQQLTVDHTLVQELIASGSLNNHPFFNKPGTHMLTRSLGTTMEIDVDAQVLDSTPIEGDVYILCTDGLHDLVPEEEFATLVLDEPPNQVANTLIELGNSRGGHDNMTVIVIGFGEGASGRKALRKPPTKAAPATITAATALNLSTSAKKEEKPEEDDFDIDLEDDETDSSYETMQDLLKRRSAEQKEKEIIRDRLAPKVGGGERENSRLLSSAPKKSAVPIFPFMVIGALLCGYLIKSFLFTSSKAVTTETKVAVADKQPAPVEVEDLLNETTAVKTEEKVKEEQKQPVKKIDEPIHEEETAVAIDEELMKKVAAIKEDRLKAMFNEVLLALSSATKRVDSKIVSISEKSERVDAVLGKLSEKIELEKQELEKQRMEPVDRLLEEGL